MQKKKRAGRKRTASYTTGQINELIDTLVHPLAKSDQRLILLDGLLHALNEKDPAQSFGKFVKYNLPHFVKQMERASRKRSSKAKTSSGT